MWQEGPAQQRTPSLADQATLVDEGLAGWRILKNETRLGNQQFFRYQNGMYPSVISVFLHFWDLRLQKLLVKCC